MSAPIELQNGSKGEEVAELQDMLSTLGLFKDPLDGIFGEHTAIAVKEYQQQHGFDANGVVGGEMIDALREDISKGDDITDEKMQDLKERIEEILDVITSETGMRARDRYPCLLRVGDDWESYPFKWEPFRDLAGPIEWPEYDPPVVIISSHEQLSEPEIQTRYVPHQHIRFIVSTTVNVTSIVNKWIEILSKYVTPKLEPVTWFLEGLDLKPSDVSPIVRSFLALETSEDIEQTDFDDGAGEKQAGFSATVRAIADNFGEVPVTAIMIAEALKEKHVEYAGNLLGGIRFDVVEAAEKRNWNDWSNSVAQLYDADTLAKSHHQVIDGRLFLIGLGLLDQLLQNELEKNNVWAQLLLEIDEAAIGSGGALRDALNSIQLAHGYKSDRTDGEDQLGIQGEVNALCEVIMDPNVTPPLAIGLFGTWGSGKSFFMGKMRERIHKLSNQHIENYPENVVQIRFNAWHYADTSLWASLAVEIFERLADPEPVDNSKHEEWLIERGDPKREEREKLLANLEIYREAKATLESERDQLKKAKRRLQIRCGQDEEAGNKAINNFQLTNIAAELVKDPEVNAGLDNISKELGLKPAVDQLSSIARELYTASGYISAIWRKLSNKTVAMGLIITALVLLLMAPAVLMGDGSWYASMSLAVSSLVSMVLAISKHILPASQTVNQGLSFINSTLETVQSVKERLATKREKEDKELDVLFANHNKKIDEAKRGIATINEKIATVTGQADALTVGRQLYNFLADRAAGYQKHQGVVGMLHRDFRFLDTQLRAQVSSENITGLPKIDRVILYIDDLDRCSPEKVLEVLEAVHLLLALELFIVIVGVDPRWLMRSLRHQYKALCLNDNPSNDPYLHTMPTEYLEKIFQIPLTLPAMESEAYGHLISSLAPGTVVPTISRKPKEPGMAARRTDSPDTTGGNRVPTRATIKVQAGSAAQGSRGKSIDLTSEEVGFIQQLGGLVDTPRAAKRLMNTYRLIRATQHVGSRSRFLGADGKPGEYFAVLTLLAVAAGFPTLVDRVLVSLEEDAKTKKIQNWEGFLNELEPGKGSYLPDEINPPKNDDLLALTDAAEWENMYNGLKESAPGNQLKELDPYQRWGRIVARFSFTL